MEIVVKKLNIDIDKNYIYFLNEDGYPVRVGQINPPGKKIKVEVLSTKKFIKKIGSVYFINKDGNVCRVSLEKNIKLENNNLFTVKGQTKKKKLKKKS